MPKHNLASIVKGFANMDDEYIRIKQDLDVELAALGIDCDDIQVPMNLVMDKLIEVAFLMGKSQRPAKGVASNG